MKISADGKMEPFAAGMRSPCGIGMINGDFFYGDNQGDWQGSGFISHVEKGDFLGHPASLAWADKPNSPVKMRKEEILLWLIRVIIRELNQSMLKRKRYLKLLF